MVNDLYKSCYSIIKYFDEFASWDMTKKKNCLKDLYNYTDSELDSLDNIYHDILQVINLKQLPLIPQRSKEWYELRTNRLTASDLAQAIGKGKFGTRSQLLEKKAFPETNVFNNDIPPLKWGTMMEDMGMRCYKQNINNVIIYEFGLIPNDEIYCFGASPDGITETGIMVEMKCPYKRKCTHEVPEQYFLQIQGQLATCKLSSCDYVECYFDSYHNICEYTIICDKTATTGHGIILEFIDDSKNYIYEYSPEYYTSTECIEWANKTVSDILSKNQEYTFLKMTPWRLNNLFHTRVAFNKQLWEELTIAIYDFWKEVEMMRINGKPSCIEPKKDTPVNKNKRILNLTTTPKYQFLQDEDENKEPAKKYIFIEDSEEES